MRIMTKLFSGAVLLLLLCTTTAVAQDLPLKNLPEEIRETVKRRWPNATIAKATRDRASGSIEVTLKFRDGPTIDLVFAQRYVVVALETPTRELPIEVFRAVQKKYPKGEIVRAERITNRRGMTTGYELVVNTGAKRTVTVHITPEGKFYQP